MFNGVMFNGGVVGVWAGCGGGVVGGGVGLQRGLRLRVHGLGRGWGFWGWVGVWVFCVWGVLGCTSALPVAPRPTVAVVPHPDRVPPELGLEELTERYSASPDHNPDGLGVFGEVWPQSYLTLVPWEIERHRQERAQRAFARTDVEQAEVLAERELFFSEHLVFEGLWVGDFPQLLDPTGYLPEGIYLMDDQGRKFLPRDVRSVEQRVPLFAPSEFGQVGTSWPLITFPIEALFMDTRALLLYVATPQRRMRFVWVFDPTYIPPGDLASLLDRRVPGR